MGSRMEYTEEMPISIGEAAEILGVSVKTARRYADADKIPYERAPSGHRRFYRSQLLAQAKKVNNERITINYVRVSSHDQKDDLVRQAQALESFSTKNGWTYETIQDLGSGLNYKKKGLKRLIKMILRGEVERLVINHKDRLLRFGAEIIFYICDEFKTEVVIVNKSEKPKDFETELVADMIELVTVFSAKLYGSRSRKNKKIVDNIVKSTQKDLETT